MNGVVGCICRDCKGCRRLNNRANVGIYSQVSWIQWIPQEWGVIDYVVTTFIVGPGFRALSAR